MLCAGQEAEKLETLLMAQLSALDAMLDPIMDPFIAGIRGTIEKGVTEIVEASNAQITCENELRDQLTAVRLEFSEYKGTIEELEADQRKSANLLAGADKLINKMEVQIQQTQIQRDNYKKQATDLKAIKSEYEKAKAQVKRSKDSVAAIEAKMKEANVLLQRQSSMISKSIHAIDAAKRHMEGHLQIFINNGLLEEKVFEDNGTVFKVFRKPCIVAETYSPTGEDLVSNDHMYVFRVETTAGVHWDCIPLADGNIGINTHDFQMPKHIEKYMSDEYERTHFYDPKDIKMKTEQIFKEMAKSYEVMRELDLVKLALQK